MSTLPNREVSASRSILFNMLSRYIGFKLFIGFVLVGSYFLLPKYGFTFNGPLINHLLYPLSHANIWHLAANILCLFMLRCPLHIVATFVCAVLCSFLPCPQLPLYGGVIEPTMGFSGVLFAMVGISWGKIHRFKDMVWRNKWILIIPAFIPHINFLIHVYCLLAGYAIGHYKSVLPCVRKSVNS